VICIGYDMVEYHPDMWNPDNDKKIVHIDALPAEVDGHYVVAVGVLGDISSSLRALALKARPAEGDAVQVVRKAIIEDRAGFANDQGFPIKPQKNRLGPAGSAGRR
jgi:acetolactate synthase-1/2/3 large subunit